MYSLRYIWREIKVPAILLLMTLVGGALGYKILYPEIGWSRIIYFTAITLSTVGYEDTLNVADDPWSTLYTVVLIFFGMGIVLYSASSITAFIIEGRLGELFKKRATMQKISSFKDHYIVCGVGETGRHVIDEISRSQQKLVVIDISQDKVHSLQSEFPNIPILCGDATSDDVLESANISNAKGLIAALNNDRDNLFLTFTAKMISAEISVVAKAVDTSMTQKLKNAGANYVVSPQYIGGMRIASIILRPHVVSFLDRMLKGKGQSVRVNEFTVLKNSRLNGATFANAEIKKNTGIDVFAYGKFHDPSEVTYNPSPDTLIEEGDVLLYISNNKDQETLEKLFT